MQQSDARVHPLGWEQRGLAPAAGGRAGGSRTAYTTRVRAPRRHVGRPGPLSVQTAAPADARAPIGAPRPPPVAPEALGPQLLSGWTRRGLAPPPARPRPRGPWSLGPARGRPPARRFMERPRPGRRGQRDPAGPCEPPAPRHHGTQGPACPPAYPPTCPLCPSERTARWLRMEGLEGSCPSPRLSDLLLRVPAGLECGSLARPSAGRGLNSWGGCLSTRG